jgi:hypothetical protein
MTEDNQKIGGFRLDNYFIALPPNNFLVEDEDGNLHVLVDIYKLDGDTQTKVSESEITPELEQRINAYINEMLLQAVEAEEGDNVKD